jgi:hypothetical protein
MKTFATTLPTEARDDAMQLMLRRAELAACIERFVPGDGIHATPILRVHLVRATRSSAPSHTLCEPGLCLLAQGRNRVLLGDEVTVYDALNYLVVAQDLPISGQVVDATPDAPYLGLRIDLEPAQIAALMLDIGRPQEPVPPVARGLFTGQTSAALLDATLRLVRLLDTPEDIAVLSPLVMREILYRILSSEHGWRLAQIGTPDSDGERTRVRLPGCGNGTGSRCAWTTWRARCT